MSWNFQDIKYGWKILAGIALTGTTIFVADNIIQRIYARDMIQIVLGTYERCLATQYSTNPVSYYVAPPSFIRSWYSNSYETTNVPGDLVTNWTAVLHTNVFTNVFGWRTDRAMLVELDAKIKALVPYYCDTNTVYDGTTNIVMLTVTGLWASLGIGDGTNQFTSVPEWVGTNGVTNAATYGDYPRRIYKTDLEERYKVLNVLKTSVIGGNLVRIYYLDYKTVNGGNPWPTNDAWLPGMTNSYTGELYAPNGPPNGYLFQAGAARMQDTPFEGTATRTRVRSKFQILGGFSTNVSIKSLSVYVQISKDPWYGYFGFPEYFYDNDPNCPGIENEYINIKTFSNPTIDLFPYNDDVLYGDNNSDVPDEIPPMGMWSVRAWKLDIYIANNNFVINPAYAYRQAFFTWNFQYCTNYLE